MTHCLPPRVPVQLVALAVLRLLYLPPADLVRDGGLHWLLIPGSRPNRRRLGLVGLWFHLSVLPLPVAVPRFGLPLFGPPSPLRSHLRTRPLGAGGSVVDILSLVQVASLSDPLLLD